MAPAEEEPFRPRKRAGVWWRELRSGPARPRASLALPLLTLALCLFSFYKLFVALGGVRPAGQGGPEPMVAAGPAIVWLLVATFALGGLAYVLGWSREPATAVKPGEGRALVLDTLRGVRDLLRRRV